MGFILRGNYKVKGMTLLLPSTSCAYDAQLPARVGIDIKQIKTITCSTNYSLQTTRRELDEIETAWLLIVSRLLQFLQVTCVTILITSVALSISCILCYSTHYITTIHSANCLYTNKIDLHEIYTDRSMAISSLCIHRLLVYSVLGRVCKQAPEWGTSKISKSLAWLSFKLYCMLVR